VTAELVANQLGEPPGGTDSATVTVDDAMHRDGDGPGLTAYFQQVTHLKRGSLDPSEGNVDLDLVPEAQRAQITNRDLDHGEVNPLRPDILVRVPEGAQTLDPGFLQIRKIRSMVDH
jgi:hypothetical protein